MADSGQLRWAFYACFKGDEAGLNQEVMDARLCGACAATGLVERSPAGPHSKGEQVLPPQLNSLPTFNLSTLVALSEVAERSSGSHGITDQHY